MSEGQGKILKPKPKKAPIIPLPHSLINSQVLVEPPRGFSYSEDPQNEDIPSPKETIQKHYWTKEEVSIEFKLG